MTTLSPDGFASVCDIRHWSLAQKVNDFFLTVFEDQNGNMFCSGTWDREHSGPVLNLSTPRSIMIPVILRPSTQVRHTNLDLHLINAHYRDASGRLVASAEHAATVHSEVYVPSLSQDLMRVFMLNAEGKHVLPGHTEFAEADIPYEQAKAMREGASSYRPAAPEQQFVRRQPEFFGGPFPPAPADHAFFASHAAA